MKQQFLQNPGTHFVQMPCIDTDSQANLHNGVILICPLSTQQSIEKYLKTERHIAHYELATTYTVGYEGQEDHIWDFSHYEAYEPANTKLPSLIVLRYRRRYFEPVNQEQVIKDCMKENVATELQTA
ncbi:MAG: hypothetical protein KME23_08805 [Goleter apudmare HA4340-LM2]|jgi:hypothetical protein|nr:hypothetical protein [Goleter apudmare HA4340-LM2]